MYPNDSLEQHLTRLVDQYQTYITTAPQIKHWTTDRHYGGVDCLSMAERSFGRALAMLENLMGWDHGPCRIGLRGTPGRPGVYDCTTPNADQSECHYRIDTTGMPWTVFQIISAPGHGEREVRAPFYAWGDLDAEPRYDASGQPANLRAVNRERHAAGKAPMVMHPSDDKHILLLELAQQQKFGFFTKKGQLHPAALREIMTGYTREKADWREVVLPATTDVLDLNDPLAD